MTWVEIPTPRSIIVKVSGQLLSCGSQINTS